MRIVFNWRGILGLPSKYIGAVYNTETKKVCSIVNPTYDYELEDDCWSKKDETLIKLPRGSIPTTMTFEDCANLIQKIERDLKII